MLNFSLVPSFTESKFHLPYFFNTTLSLVLHSLFWLTPTLSTSPSVTSLIFSSPWWTAFMQNVSVFVNVFSVWWKKENLFSFDKGTKIKWLTVILCQLSHFLFMSQLPPKSLGFIIRFVCAVTLLIVQVEKSLKWHWLRPVLQYFSHIHTYIYMNCLPKKDIPWSENKK